MAKKYINYDPDSFNIDGLYIMEIPYLWKNWIIMVMAPLTVLLFSGS